MTPFTDPEAVGTELPDRDPGTDCQFHECEKLEAGEEIGANIDAAVLEVFDE
jgi:hypothetical protein